MKKKASEMFSAMKMSLFPKSNGFTHVILKWTKNSAGELMSFSSIMIIKIAREFIGKSKKLQGSKNSYVYKWQVM